MPTQGTHNPDVPYVACSDMAWGPKGSEHMKSAADMEYEEKVNMTPTSYQWNNGDIAIEGNHEVRLKEKDSSFVPNVGNLCPRPKNWTAVGFENYGAK